MRRISKLLRLKLYNTFIYAIDFVNKSLSIISSVSFLWNCQNRSLKDLFDIIKTLETVFFPFISFYLSFITITMRCTCIVLVTLLVRRVLGVLIELRTALLPLSFYPHLQIPSFFFELDIFAKLGRWNCIMASCSGYFFILFSF